MTVDHPKSLEAATDAADVHGNSTVTMDVSVVICTYNRASMLRDSLASWMEVDVGAHQTELVVVDNASTDETRAVVAEFGPTPGGPLRYVHEPTPGLSQARNRGIREARGQIIAFVDDDVFFDRCWLQMVMKVFQQQPEVHCVGGNSIPVFESERPPWLDDSMLTYYGSTLSGNEDRVMRFPEHPFGVNMAFRREVFDRVGNFRTNLGRKKDSLLSNEERELFHRISAADLAVYYAASAVIYHRVPAERLDEHWILRRAYWQGVSTVVFAAHAQQRSRLRLGKDLALAVKRLSLGTGLRNPRSIIEYHRTACLNTRMKKQLLLGTARQSLIELFRASGSNG
ncbi:MAG: glycosyltransferase family 2 protein [Pseudomonadales bacterium]